MGVDWKLSTTEHPTSTPNAREQQDHRYLLQRKCTCTANYKVYKPADPFGCYPRSPRAGAVSRARRNYNRAKSAQRRKLI